MTRISNDRLAAIASALFSLAAAGAGSAPTITIEGDTLHITIGGGSVLDIASLRRMFNQLMDEQAAKKAARLRSALFDQE